MVVHDNIMENFTSPAARIEYAGIKAGTHTIGLMMVIQVTIKKHSLPLSALIPPRWMIGFVRANTSSQLMMITTSDTRHIFFV